MARKKSPPVVGLLVVFFCFVPSTIFPQVALKKITYEQAYLNKEPFLLKPMTTGFWLDDESYLLRERDDKGKMMRLLKVSVKTGEKTLFLDYSALQKGLPQGVMAVAAADMSPDYSRFIYSFQNDLYLYLTTTQAFRRLTATPAGL